MLAISAAQKLKDGLFVNAEAGCQSGQGINRRSNDRSLTARLTTSPSRPYLHRRQIQNGTLNLFIAWKINTLGQRRNMIQRHPNHLPTYRIFLSGTEPVPPCNASHMQSCSRPHGVPSQQSGFWHPFSTFALNRTWPDGAWGLRDIPTSISPNESPSSKLVKDSDFAPVTPDLACHASQRLRLKMLVGSIDRGKRLATGPARDPI
jgi:hypothetical protein